MHRTFLLTSQAILLFLGGCVLPTYIRPTSGPVAQLEMVKGAPSVAVDAVFLFPGARCTLDRRAESLPSGDWAKSTLPSLGEVDQAGTVVRAGEPLLIEYRAANNGYIKRECALKFLFTPDEGVTYTAFGLMSRDSRRCALTVQATGDRGGSYAAWREVSNQYEPKNCVWTRRRVENPSPAAPIAVQAGLQPRR